MKVTGTIKKIVKPLVDVPSWMGTEWIGHHWTVIRDSFQTLFYAREVTYTEDFSQAMARLGLTEADLKKRVRDYSILFIIFLVFGIGVFLYMLYLLSELHWRGGIIAFAVAFFAFAQAFRCHFWVFQIKQRRLGCTFKDWVNGTFRGKK